MILSLGWDIRVDSVNDLFDPFRIGLFGSDEGSIYASIHLMRFSYSRQNVCELNFFEIVRTARITVSSLPCPSNEFISNLVVVAVKRKIALALGSI